MRLARTRRFRELFGPDVLAGLDGQNLLDRMHLRGTKDSLVYWLEFKDDDEFPAARFGSIGGGSALKFGIYWAADTKQWMGGSGNQQSRLTIDEAVARARTQRDQLLAGARVLAGVPTDPAAIDYSALQDAIVKAAPDLAETSWGHKYLSLLFPAIIESFHGADYQEHQLLKLLKLPGRGRYENARIFAGVGEAARHELARPGHDPVEEKRRTASLLASRHDRRRQERVGADASGRLRGSRLGSDWRPIGRAARSGR